MADALVITGIGAVSAAGVGVAALRRLTLAGGRAQPPGAAITLPGGGVLDPGFLGRAPGACARVMDHLADGVPQALCVEWGTLAAREALADAAILGRIASPRIALCVGSNLEDRPDELHVLADRIAGAVGITGPRVAVSVACASSTAGFALARDLLVAGDLDAVVVGGCDVLTPRVIAGFRLLGLIAAGPCAPFSARAGTSLGEGAGFVVLERRAANEGTEALLGEGLAADAHHPTAPEPQGRGLAAAIAAAMRAAGVAPDDIDAVNAHATGTEANDDAELRGLRHALGARADAIPVSASKSVLGHAQGAAGALELIVALLARRAGLAPPTVNFQPPARPSAPRDFVAEGRPRPHAHDLVLSLSAGFGGANAAVLVGSARKRPSTHSSRPVRLVRAASISAAGLRTDGFTLAELAALAHRRVGELPWRQLVRSCDLRRKHPATRFLTAAVAHAVDAHLPESARTGLCVGQRRTGPAAIDRVREQIRARGLLGASATAYAESLTVNCAGDCAAAHALRGPFNVVCAGDCSGLLALVHAAGLFTRDPAVRSMIAAAVDEAETPANMPGDPVRADIPFEGAVAVALADDGPWTLASAVIAGPGLLDTAVQTALTRANLDAHAIAGQIHVGVAQTIQSRESVLALPPLGAAGGLLALHHGLATFTGPFVVAAGDPHALTCAIVVPPAGAPSA